jgi:hypothetical protein
MIVVMVKWSFLKVSNWSISRTIFMNSTPQRSWPHCFFQTSSRWWLHW